MAIDSNRVVYSVQNGEEKHTCTFDRDFRPLQSQSFEGRRLIRTVTYSEFGKLLDGPANLPGRILLINHRWHYRMEIEILKLQGSISGEEVFNLE